MRFMFECCQRINVKPLEIPFKGAKSPVQVDAKRSGDILNNNLIYIVPFWDLAGILLLIYPVCCETPFKKMLAVRMYSKNGFVYNTLSGKQSWEVINTVLLS